MDLGGSDSKARRQRMKVHAEALRAPVPPRGEVLEDGDHLVGTFYLPAHDPRDVKYHVGRRTITLWSRKTGSEFQTILVLPRWVRPETFILSHKNGIYEFTLEHGEDPHPRAPPAA
jgi:hypothetical protein